MFESFIQWPTNLCYSDNTCLLVCTSYELMELFIFSSCFKIRELVLPVMGDLVVREAYLKRGGFLQLIIISSSAFLRHGFPHSVKAYRRSRLLSCGKSKRILLPVVINLNTPGLFFFFLFFFFAVRRSNWLEWSASILLCSVFVFFFHYSRNLL